MRTKSNSEYPLCKPSKEEIAELFANLEPIELPDGPLTNEGEPCVITTCTLTEEELGLKNHAKRGKVCSE